LKVKVAQASMLSIIALPKFGGGWAVVESDAIGRYPKALQRQTDLIFWCRPKDVAVQSPLHRYSRELNLQTVLRKQKVVDMQLLYLTDLELLHLR
jgi:hypothetical protein